MDLVTRTGDTLSMKKVIEGVMKKTEAPHGSSN